MERTEVAAVVEAVGGSPEPAYCPTPPMSLADMDISEGLLSDLVLRRLYLQGEGSVSGLCRSLMISFPVARQLFETLRSQQLLQVKGIDGSDYRFVLTGAGRALAAERMLVCQYAGPCPVSLKTYQEAVKAQAAQVAVDRESLRAAFSDLVVTDRLLDQVGPALVSQGSIFLYGPTGNGKTSLAERFLRVFDDAVVVPYAVTVDAQIIVLYDPVVHRRVSPPPAAPGPDLDRPERLDPRWVPCRRPSVLAGGELVDSMLELQVDEATGIYAAPLQMKANNGILVIDDFGRQVISPRHLLNRWIVPLDRRVDYLALRYGTKFEIPFEMLVVFATNLEPGQLADEAFFRRISNKIYVEPVSAEVFGEIFRRLVRERNLPCEADAETVLHDLCREKGRGELRACYPRDLVDIVTAISTYEGRPVRIDRPALERATAIYFTRNTTAEG